VASSPWRARGDLNPGSPAVFRSVFSPGGLRTT